MGHVSAHKAMTLAIDIEHFVQREVSRCIAGRIMRTPQAPRKAPGQYRIYVAAEQEYEMQVILREQAIPINEILRRELRIIQFPQPLRSVRMYR